MRTRRIISYALFEPTRLYDERAWDRHRGVAARYWFNLPAIALCNQALYEGFETRVHVARRCVERPQFPVLDLLTERVPGFHYVVVEDDYREFEPSLWRMMPFWAPDTEILLCRDVDSLPNATEWGATLRFLRGGTGMHSIRAHPHHREPLRLLAGLCGFRPERLLGRVPAHDFAAYAAMARGVAREDDQELLNRVFARDDAANATELLDSPIDEQHERAPYPHRPGAPSGRVATTEQGFRVLEWVRHERLTPWAGAPCSARGPALERLLQRLGRDDLRRALHRDAALKRTYLGKG